MYEKPTFKEQSDLTNKFPVKSKYLRIREDIVNQLRNKKKRDVEIYI